MSPLGRFAESHSSPRRSATSFDSHGNHDDEVSAITVGLFRYSRYCLVQSARCFSPLDGRTIVSSDRREFTTNTHSSDSSECGRRMNERTKRCRAMFSVYSRRSSKILHGGWWRWSVDQSFVWIGSSSIFSLHADLHPCSPDLLGKWTYLCDNDSIKFE